MQINFAEIFQSKVNRPPKGFCGNHVCKKNFQNYAEFPYFEFYCYYKFNKINNQKLFVIRTVHHINYPTVFEQY